MRVLLVDDNRLMLEGLKNLLAAHGIEVLGIASNGREGEAMAQALHPDLILMDIRMPVCDGLEATRIIKARQPEIRIVMLTTSINDEDLFDAIKSGACGYLIKNMSGEAFIEALRGLEQGTPPFSPGLAAALLEEFARLASGTKGQGEPEKGERGEMMDLLSESGFGKSEAFYRVGQAISETLPNESKEKKLLDGFLAGRERLREEITKAQKQEKLL